MGQSIANISLRTKILVSAVVVFFLFLQLTCVRRPLDLADTAGITADVYNATFGFGAIILISLPHRTDRRDAVTLLSSLYGVKVTHIIDGVKGDDVDEKAKPFGKARDTLESHYWGSWRAHMNAFKHIIEMEYETALIIEDDVDWDVQIREQLRALSEGFHKNELRAPLTEDETARAPYGFDWDLIHLGQSILELPPAPFDELHHNYYDPHTPYEYNDDKACTEEEYFCWSQHYSKANPPPSHRTIFPSYGPLGLTAIGVTRRGAQKLIYNMSWKDLDFATDKTIRTLLSKGSLQGYTVIPPLFGNWVAGGPKDSDNAKKGFERKLFDGKIQGNMHGKTRALSNSARQDMKERLGATNNW